MLARAHVLPLVYVTMGFLRYSVKICFLMLSFFIPRNAKKILFLFISNGFRNSLKKAQIPTKFSGMSVFEVFPKNIF